MPSPQLPPSKKGWEGLKSTLKEIAGIFFTYVKGKMKIAFIIGVIAYIFFWLLKIPYPALLAITVAIFNIIPYLGPILGGGIVVIVSLVLGSINKALWALLIIIILQVLDGWYLEPKILGKAFGIKPLWIMIIVFIGGAAFGIPGMIFAIPVAVITKLIYEKYLYIKK